jgi:hypothetical protein
MGTKKGPRRPKLPKRPSKAEVEFWKEPEWTFKRAIKRLFAYTFTFFLVCMFLLVLSEGFDDGWDALDSCLHFLVGILFCFWYIYMDAQILLEKGRRRKAEAKNF